MDACSSCGYEVLPDKVFCTNCGSLYSRARTRANPESGYPSVTVATANDQSSSSAATNFYNPAIEALTAQLDQAVQQPKETQAPRNVRPIPAPLPREYRKPPLTIGGWSPFDKVRFRWGGGGAIVLGIALIGGGHSAGTTVFGLLFIALGIATWIITRFGVRGHQEFGDDWYSAWNSMSTSSRAVAGTGSVIGMLFLYILFFWFFIILWVIKNVLR